MGSKTKTYKADKIAADIKGLGRQGTGLQKSALSTLTKDPTGMVNAEIAQKERFARSSGEDEIRRAKEISAQRGLGNSSIGLALESGANRRTSENINDIRAQRGAMERGFAQQNFDIGSQLIKQRGPIQMNKLKVKEKGIGGALLGAAGTAVGAMYGGPAGAKVGGSIGGALGEAF